MLKKFPLIMWISGFLCLNPLHVFADPCLPKTGTVSSLIKTFEAEVKPITEKLLRPSHADFVRAVNAIECDDFKGGIKTYDDLVEDMLTLFAKESRDTAPFQSNNEEDLDELLSIFIYTAGCYENINNLTETAATQKIQSYIDMTKIALNRLPPYRGMVMRGSDLGGMGDAHQRGKVIRYRNFISTSKEKQFLRKEYQLMIHSETGRYVAPYAAIRKEEEVLFPPGTTFQVQDRVKPDPTSTAIRKTASSKIHKNKWNPDPSDSHILAVIVLKEVPSYQGKALLLPFPPESQH